MVNSENIFLRNRAANDYETWYVTLMTRALKSVVKWCPLIDFQLFYGKVKLVHLGLCMEKGKTVDFFSDSVVACDIIIDLFVLC